MGRVSEHVFCISTIKGRAEVAIKMAKRLIMANTGDGDSLNTDRMALALLQYLNTLLKGGDRSPAQLAAGKMECRQPASTLWSTDNGVGHCR